VLPASAPNQTVRKIVMSGCPNGPPLGSTEVAPSGSTVVPPFGRPIVHQTVTVSVSAWIAPIAPSTTTLEAR
jgi:hypothetical protein